MYLPIAQHFGAGNESARPHEPAIRPTLFAAIRREIRALDSTPSPPTLTTLRQATSVSLLPQRVAVAVTGVLGLLGLLLAAVGLYGVLASRPRSAAPRSEFGSRSARCARDVVRLVVGEGMRLVGIGMVGGPRCSRSSRRRRSSHSCSASVRSIR